MKKIIDFFKNELQKRKMGTIHHDDEVVISLRQMSIICALMILMLFFTFIMGYFLGKKNAAEQFLYKVEQESLADQIYSSMCVLSDKDEGENAEGIDEENDGKDENETEEDAVGTVSMVEAEEETTSEEPVVVQRPLVAKKQYYAQLAGFGSRASAKRLEQRLKDKDFAVEILEKQSKTAKGKPVTWYQVVTKKFEQKTELVSVVNKIKKLEHLSGVNIVPA